MKKILLLVLLMTITISSYAKEIVATDKVIYIVDGKKVYFCTPQKCRLVTYDYTK